MYMSMYMYSYVQVGGNAAPHVKESTTIPSHTYNASISSHAGHLLVNAKASTPQLQSAQP